MSMFTLGVCIVKSFEMTCFLQVGHTLAALTAYNNNNNNNVEIVAKMS